MYVPAENQINIAGDVPFEVRAKALFHELAHWIQDMTGNEFYEDEANDFAEKVYEALPSAQPEIIRCRDCEYWYKSWTSDWLPNYHHCSMTGRVCGENWYCADAERRTDE